MFWSCQLYSLTLTLKKKKEKKKIFIWWQGNSGTSVTQKAALTSSGITLKHTGATTVKALFLS